MVLSTLKKREKMQKRIIISVENGPHLCVEPRYLPFGPEECSKNLKTAVRIPDFGKHTSKAINAVTEPKRTT